MLEEKKKKILKILIDSNNEEDSLIKDFIKEIDHIYSNPYMFLSFLKELEENKTLKEVESIYSVVRVDGVIKASIIAFLLRKKENKPAYEEALFYNILATCPLDPWAF